MLVDLFYLLRPLIDVFGVLTLSALCIGATLFGIVMLVKTFWKFFVAFGVGSFIFFIIYLCTNGFTTFL